MTPDQIKWVRDLEDEVAHLRRTLKSITDGDGADPRDLWYKLGLTAMEQRLLRVLMLRSYAPRGVMMDALYWDKRDTADPKIIDVLLTRIRKKLPFLRPHIVVKYGEGHSLTPEGKHRLMFELRYPTGATP